MDSFSIPDRRPPKRSPFTVRPENLKTEPGLFVGQSRYLELEVPVRVEERGERVESSDLKAGAVAMSLQRRHLTDRAMITPSALITAGRGDLSCQTLADAERQQSVNRQVAASFSGSGRLYDQAVFDEISKAGPVYGGTASSDLHSGTWTSQPGTSRIDAEAWAIFTRCMHRLDTPPSSLRVPRGTAHGYPTFTTADDDLLAHVALGMDLHQAAGAGRLSDMIGEVESLCPSGVGLFILANTRTQNIRKAQKIHAFGAGGVLHHVGDSEGVFPRTRLVRMVPTFVNEACRPTVQQRTDAYKAGPLGHCFSHGRSEITLAVMSNSWALSRRRTKRTKLVTSDLTNMDDTVSAVHLKDAFNALKYDRGTSVISEWLIEQPMMGGALYGGDSGFLFSRNLGVLSGQIATSQLDTVIRFAASLHCLMAAGAFSSYSKLEAALYDRTALILVQGDDWLYIGPEFNEDAFIVASTALGFTERVEDYPVFLKTWYDLQNQRAHGLAVRSMIRSQTRERKAAGPLMEAFATGLRFEVSRNDPLHSDFFELARQTVPYLQEFKHWSQLLHLPFKFPGQFERELKTPQGVESFRDALDVLKQADVVEGFLARLAKALPTLKTDTFKERFDKYTTVDRSRPGDWRKYLTRYRSQRDSPKLNLELEEVKEEFDEPSRKDGD